MARARTDLLVICCAHLASWALLDNFTETLLSCQAIFKSNIVISCPKGCTRSPLLLWHLPALLCLAGQLGRVGKALIDPFLVAPLRVALWLRSLSLEFPTFLPQLPFLRSGGSKPIEGLTSGRMPRALHTGEFLIKVILLPKPAHSR